MRADLITQKVPNADPDFIRIMEKLPDPPPGVYEKIIEALPKLYKLFFQKRKAAAKNDVEAFTRVVEKEVDLIKTIEKQ